jgi:hypothetical protein
MKLRSNLPQAAVEKELQEMIISAEDSQKRRKTSPLACFRGINLTRTLTLFGVGCLNAAQGKSQ